MQLEGRDEGQERGNTGEWRGKKTCLESGHSAHSAKKNSVLVCMGLPVHSRSRSQWQVIANPFVTI